MRCGATRSDVDDKLGVRQRVQDTASTRAQCLWPSTSPSVAPPRCDMWLGGRLVFMHGSFHAACPRATTSRSSPSARPSRRLLFVHGSFHAAWCWAQHWMPFFSSAGFPCYAFSLRAQVVACSGCWSDCVDSMHGCYLPVL
jgi:pimeloyl-ACP methyl ester carboxylesterase